MSKFTKEEKIILFTILIAIFSGIIINVLTSYNKKIVEKKTKLKKININTADIEELQKLPGVGKIYAERIIKYREEHGGFKTIKEIKNIKGIGEKKYNKLKNFIIVE